VGNPLFNTRYSTSPSLPQSSREYSITIRPSLIESFRTFLQALDAEQCCSLAQETNQTFLKHYSGKQTENPPEISISLLMAIFRDGK
jgi:hypothetical protein